MKKKKRPVLDLHGYKSDDVFDAVDKFLMKYGSSPHNSIFIMTGKGKGIVKKLVSDYLKTAGYHFKNQQLENGSINEGVLEVFLN